MAITTQTIRVDLNTGKTIPVAYVHQSDSARTIMFDMYLNGVQYDLTGISVKFAYKSPIVNGSHIVIAGTNMASGAINGNKVTFTLPDAYTRISGVGMLTMVLSSGGTIRPVNIKLVVQSSADGADAIASASDFPATIEGYVNDWLNNNFIMTIDKTLTHSNEAADAKVTGDNIRGLEQSIAMARSNSYTKRETDSAIAAYVIELFKNIASGVEFKHDEWHQCPESVRNFLSEAMTLYPNSGAYVTCVDEYAPKHGEVTPEVIIANTKPIGYTVDNITFYDNEPNVATPFATEHTMGTLTAKDWLRWYNTTPASPAAGSQYPRGRNCRDLGGWNCDGGKIKYGLLVRGSEPNVADKALMVDKIGIRTEVQLLPVSEQADAYKKSSPWGIDWAGNDTENTTVYSPSEVSDPAKKALWAKILTDIIDSVIYGKPVYFHCGVGADRTGVTAIVLEGILGVSRSNVDIDFELTNFDQGWQTINGNIYRGRSYPTYISMMDAFASIPLVGGLTDSFRNRCISFALSLGIPRAKINSFRTTMIDGTPEEIVLANTYSVTKNLRYCTTTSTETEVDEASTFTASFSPDVGYTLKNANITITMGGQSAMQYYSNGVLSIPNVTGNIVISITAKTLPNLFDESAATYNARIRNVGAIATGQNGRIVTGVIPISDISNFAVKGITEVAAGDNVFAQLAVYSSSTADESSFLHINNYASATYNFDVDALKQDYPTAAYARLGFTLSTTAISTADTVDLEIYGA